MATLTPAKTDRLREKRETLWDKWRNARGGAMTRWRIESQIALICEQLGEYPAYYGNLRKPERRAA